MSDADDLFSEATAGDVVCGLVRIDSRNPELVPGAPGEGPIAAHCAEWLRAHAVDAWIDEVRPGRVNAVARVGEGAPTLVLCAHLDTVATDGMSSAALEGRAEGGRVYGRGAYDMKGGVAAIMLAMAALARRPPRGTVLAALVCDEEYASVGAADFVARYPADACIVTEPSEGRLILAHKGFVWAEIRTRGVAAHGSRWQDGRSAIGRMARIIAALEEHDAHELRARSHPLTGPASLHCAMVSGGAGWSTYAPECTLRVERRTLPGETAETVLEELREVVRATGIEAEVRAVLDRPPLECAADSRIANAVRAAARELDGADPEDAGVAYWMDAALFAEAGVPTVDYGPTGAGAHAALEWVELASVTRCAHVLQRAAEHFCR
ncbi:MAG TPA: M20/M25/M40 family metallo-hydrolase [Longimicrobiales bacterium]|nr:M20/M25/M40 family metallo-hydrolase [Longimicrobiales bacterium]